MHKNTFSSAAFLSIVIIITTCASSCASFYKHITLINRTGGPLSLQIIDKPLRRSDVPHLEFYRLDHYEEMQLNAQARIVGWYQPGEATGNTVLTYEDDIIVFIKHDGAIKTLHGPLRTFPLENHFDYPVIAKTKNYHASNIDCTDCMTSCSSSQHCSCLDTCHDTTEDLTWHLAPYEQRNVQVASRTKIGMYEDTSSQPEAVITRTRYYY
jgi:hypothetical protein